MRRLITRSLAALALGAFMSGSGWAGLMSVTSSGTFGAAVPSSTWTAPNETWAFSFELDSNPSVSNNSTFGFDVPFSAFSYSLNGGAVATTPASIRFFTSADGGMLSINFTPVGVDASPDNGFEFFGVQAFSGTTSTPTIQTGSYTAGDFGSFHSDFRLASAMVQNLDGTKIDIAPFTPSTVPEPSTVVPLAAIIFSAFLFARRKRWA